MIVFEHTFATLLIWLGLFVALGIGAFSVWRWAPRTVAMGIISTLHVLFLVVLLWCLLIPGKKTVETRTIQPRFVIALDTSKSMLLSPDETVPNRWDQARDVLEMPWLNSVKRDCKIDFYTFDSDVSQPASLDQLSELSPEGERTLLRDALKKITSRYTGVNVVGGLLLSDGVDTREAFEEWAAESQPFKFYTIQLEPDAVWEQEPDLRINTVQTPERVTVEWKTDLKAVISGQGAAGAVNVQLFKDGVLVQEMPTQIPSDGGSREVTFALEHPEIGVNTYRVYLPPLKGESNTADNEYSVTVHVIDAKNRLLYVEGAPRWESKYLTRALQANTEVTPLIFLQGPEGKPMSFGTVGSMTADMTEQQLSFFKIIIIGNLDAEEISERRAQNLMRYVESGGSLVLLGGTKAWSHEGFAKTSLKTILPAKSYTSVSREGEFPVLLADMGRSHPAFAGDIELWDIIPPVLSVFPDVVPTQAARVLVEAQTAQGPQPMILTHRHGQGKVVAIFTDSLWKWKLHPQASQMQPYERFWNQMISWLLPVEDELEKDKLSIMADCESLVIGEEIVISVRESNENNDADIRVRCEITLPGGEKAPFTMRPEHVMTASGKTYPGFSTHYKATVPGLHTVTASLTADGSTRVSEELSFFVKPFAPEMTPGPCNTRVLRSIALNSGGRFFKDPIALDATLASLNFPTIEEQSSEHRSLWQTWFVIVCLTLLASLSWVVRKMNNMP